MRDNSMFYNVTFEWPQNCGSLFKV